MENIWLSLILSSALAALAIWRKAITNKGIAIAWLCSVCICYFGGWVNFLCLAATLICTLIAGKISGKKRENAEKKLHAKHGKRDGVQIICNVFMSALMAIIYGITDNHIFLCAGAAALAASLADSMASELGILSRGKTFDVLSGKATEPGMSGGVSFFGFAMSALGAAIIAAISLGQGMGVKFSVVILISGFVAAYVDSLLGAAAQAKYRCGVCGALTEKKVHCGEKGAIEKGLSFIDNDMVNFLNNLTGAVIAMILYVVI
ncbi:MAG: DUF92 domain-containing protein [Oscillospiraceae bacterium]|nr:DUF92 domain-containing protein [Oscillospiraceae bacterium]